MTHDKLRVISAKDLGKLAMPDFCPRCFWLERHLGNPPSIFPGIFSTLDAVTKRNVHWCFSKNRTLPSWLSVPDAVEVEEDDINFKLPVRDKGWVLVGKPDDIFKLRDGTYHIVDYKTAKFTGRQDELFPMYRIQLNAYAYLAEKYGFEPVRKLSLIYCQPNEDLDDHNDFRLSFQTYHLEIPLELERVPELLAQAREIIDQSEIPEATYDCKGICRWMEEVLLKIQN